MIGYGTCYDYCFVDESKVNVFMSPQWLKVTRCVRPPWFQLKRLRGGVKDWKTILWAQSSTCFWPMRVHVHMCSKMLVCLADITGTTACARKLVNTFTGRKHVELCAQKCFSILTTASTFFQLKIEEALHNGWESPSLNKQVNHVNLTLSF